VPPRDLAALRAAIRPQTRLVIGETIGNPGLEVLDIAAWAEIAHAQGLPLLIDNTFASPILCRPLDLGADLVMHSLTKWIGGHGIVIGGAIIDGGRFDWRASGKFPTLTEPVPRACAISAPACRPLMPFTFCRVSKRCPCACAGIWTIPMKSWGRRAGAKFIDALKLASHLANVGDAKTLVIHPASTTHQQLSPEQLAEAGVPEDLVRLSVGLEDAVDIIADLEQALRASQKE
jgi:O-acetylhomoserine/O-acetylserine sulfhydrylase-like pyridoxal-dependent enzyme